MEWWLGDPKEWRGAKNRDQISLERRPNEYNDEVGSSSKVGDQFLIESLQRSKHDNYQMKIGDDAYSYLRTEEEWDRLLKILDFSLSFMNLRDTCPAKNRVLMLAASSLLILRDDDVDVGGVDRSNVMCVKIDVGFKTSGLNIVNDNIGSAFMSTSKLNDSIIWHARLCHVHFKRMQDMSKDGLIPAFDMDTKKCKTCMLTKITKKPFQNVKRETEVLEMIHSDLCDLHVTPSLGNKKYFMIFIDDASRFCYIYLLHSKDEALDKFKVFKTEVELQQESLIKRFGTDRGGERGIECIFVRYAKHSKAFRFYVIEHNDSVSMNSIIESRDAIFDENRFSSVPRPSLRIPNRTKDIGDSVVPKKVTEEVVQQPEPELRKSKRNKTPKNFGPEFQLYLIEETMDEVSDQHSYCFNVENDPKNFDEAMKSQDVAFWKETINDEMDSIMGNNTWVLADLPPGCKPLGCKWIFKRKLKVDGTIKKFKARLVIQSFKQKSRIDYFDSYALVAHISIIRLLIVMSSIHNLIIHQMDVKTTFLNEKLEKEVYMNQPQGFIMPGNENKVCKLIKSLYELKHAPKQWHQKFNEVVLSDGYLLNQADKFQVDLTKEFLSSRFSMKNMGETDVIL
ncbi:zinc finger, CCHC-type containing protein, partial [Tanacetum coccineum]